MPRNEQSHNALMIAYHSINEYTEDRIRVPNIVTPAAFEEQIQYLASTARMISLQEFLDHRKDGIPLKNKSIIVTFDDGYRDNLTIASPILQKYGVPATFFITTGYIGSERMKWEDQLSCLIRRSKVEVVSLDLPSIEISLKLGSDKEKFKALDTLVKSLGHLNPTERSHVLDELRHQLEVDCVDQAGVMMTWEDVRQLANTPGFSIGSHSVSHPHLTRIPSDDVRRELTNSKDRLENELGRSVAMFAYPYGDFNDEVITTLQAAGYTSAGTIEYGQNSIRTDPFHLKRVLVPNQQGVKFQAGMRLRTSIFGEFLRKNYNTFNTLRKRIVH